MIVVMKLMTILYYICTYVHREEIILQIFYYCKFLTTLPKRLEAVRPWLVCDAEGSWGGGIVLAYVDLQQ